MPNPVAILVEDEPTSAAKSKAALEALGFDVVTFADAITARAGIAASDQVVDLLVLDRRLPIQTGEPASDDVGDELLDWALEQLSDLVIVVFSGHTDFLHAQRATQRRGSISISNGTVTLDRVSVFEKGQSLEFDTYVREVRDRLTEIEDIQLHFDGGDLTKVSARLLRRIAHELSGITIHARELEGGLTGSPVWLCDVHNDAGPVARVVAKRQVKRPVAGGFQTLLPPVLCASSTGVVTGFCSGYYVSVQQVVGGEPESLLQLVARDPALANQLLEELTQALSDLPSAASTNIRVDEVTEAIYAWDAIVERGEVEGVSVPPGSKVATTVRSAQHGDLHPGNVLAADGRPILIDFDSQTFTSELVDAVALAFGPIFHAASPLRESAWPTPEQCSAPFDREFLDECPSRDYFETAINWISTRSKSERELFAVVLAYSARQLKYDDVRDNHMVKARAIALMRWAAEHLRDS